MKKVEMDAKQSRIFRLACEVLSGKYTIKEFSILINKSYRQAQRIVKRVENEDLFGVIHKNTGRAPLNKTSEKFEGLIVDLLKYKYAGFNLTHFKEKLEEIEKIKIPKSTLHRIASKHGLVKNPRRRVRRSFKPRPRVAQKGSLVQFDGSDHVWFGEQRSDLIAAIDDATGEILAAEFFKGETSMNSMKVIKEVVDNNGLPEAFYMDQAGIYGKVDKEWDSQIGRAFEQVNIRLILASTPQAKGRIERLFRTLQDRLVTELKFYNIVTLKEANRFLKYKFIKRFNEQFSVVAQEDSLAFRKNVFGNLNLIFCKKERRKIGVGNAFSYGRVTYVVDDKRCFRGREVNINTHIDGSQSFDIMGRAIAIKIVDSRRKYDYQKRAV